MFRGDTPNYSRKWTRWWFTEKSTDLLKDVAFNEEHMIRGTNRYLGLSLLIPVLFTVITTPAITQEKNQNGEEQTDRQISEQQEKRIKKLIQQLGSKNYKKRKKATNQLVEIGKPVVPYVRKKVDADNPELRKRAISVLKQLGEWKSVDRLVEERVEIFRKSISDKDMFSWNPQNAGSRAHSWQWKRKLREISDEYNSADDFLHSEVINRLMEDRNALNETAIHNLSVLLRKAEEEAVPAAVDALVTLADTDEEEIRGRSLVSLRELFRPDQGERIKPVVERAIASDNWRLKVEGLRLADKIRTSDMVSTLLNLLDHDKPLIRYEAFYSLTRITGRFNYFNAWWDEKRRKEVVKNWKTWWKKNKEDFTPVPLTKNNKEN